MTDKNRVSDNQKETQADLTRKEALKKNRKLW